MVAGRRHPQHRRGVTGRRLFRATAIVGVVALMSTGALAAVAAPGDSSNAQARFLSGSLLTSAGTLDSLLALQGSTATNNGSATADTQTSSLDLTALSALNVTIPGGVTIPLSQFLTAGIANQYAQASDNGVSRAGSGAVSNSGVVDLTGTGAFPSNASIDLVNMLGNPAPTVLSAGNISLGAVTGVAALDAAQAGGPAVSCADLSNPINCRGYNVVNATMNLTSPLIGSLATSLVGPLTTVNTAVNGLSSTLLNDVTGVINSIPALAVLTGTNDLAVTVNANLLGAVIAALPATVSQGGVTLTPGTGAITVDLGAVIGGLNNRAPNTALLSATVINTIVGDLGTILTTLQADINTAVQTGFNAAPVTISGGICVPAGCTAPLGGKLSLAYTGTLGDLAAGTAVITASGTGVVPAILAPVVTTLTTTLASTLAGVVTTARTTALSTIATALTTAVTSLTTALNPVLQGIGAAIGITLNVQEPGTAANSYREVAVRASLLGGAGATVDLGRAEVGANVKAAVVPPAITSLTPTHGPAAGGTAVTITGIGFTGATGVTFGGTAGTAFAVVSDTQITVTTPAHTAGPVGVVVLSPNGNSAPGTFTFVAPPAAPAITSLTPTSGPTTGGTVVTITGTGFTGATGVTFGGTAGTAFSVVSATEIIVTTPAHAAGPFDVVVQSPNGDSAPGTFTFVAAPAPVITSVSPTHGPDTGGTVVTVTGTGFTGATGVTFGGTAGTAFTVVSGTEITVTTPAHTAGPVSVVVQSPNGDSAAGTFTFDPATSISTVDPNSGPEAGGTTVTITGLCFTGATQVLFGTTPATSFRVVSDTTITAVSPAGTGKVDVTVVGSTACGTSTLPHGFSYVAPAVAPALAALAKTGADVLVGAWLAAFALMLAGVGLVVFRRRRTVK